MEKLNAVIETLRRSISTAEEKVCKGRGSLWNVYNVHIFERNKFASGIREASLEYKELKKDLLR